MPDSRNFSSLPIGLLNEGPWIKTTACATKSAAEMGLANSFLSMIEHGRGRIDPVRLAH